MAKSATPAARKPRPVGVVLDTCVWLDLAQQHTNEPLLVALELLCRQRSIDLIVPQIVRDEFARNKVRVIRDSGRSLSGTLKRAREAIWTYGDPKTRHRAAEILQDIDHRLYGSIEVAAEAVKRIEKLFSEAICCHCNDDAVLSASKRAMEKKAPFHHDKNSFADAVLIELYGQVVRNPKNARYVFVTNNTRDFSAVGGDMRLPHPDIANYFSKIKSRYFIKLVDALRAMRPREFTEAMYESEFSTEPRKASEISDVISELVDRVWYDRHMVMMHKIHTGRCKVIPSKEFQQKHYRASGLGLLVTDGILAGAQRSARRLEKKYGKENLGPYSKFEWGMINGKLSALRWVFGEDWDELYT